MPSAIGAGLRGTAHRRSRSAAPHCELLRAAPRAARDVAARPRSV